jgi:hypothetical protein
MKKLLVIICFIYCVLMLPKGAHAFENGDFQIWNTYGVDVKVNEKLKITAEEELRFGGNVSELFYTHTDGGLHLNVTDGLVFGVNYRLIYAKSERKWKEENRPHFNVTLKGKLKDFKLSNRSRLELRIKDDSDTWRYRNKTKVTFPVKWTKFEIQPYIADEVFIDFHGDCLNQNRLYAGFGAKLFKHLKTDIYYVWQTAKVNNGWSNFHALGLKMKLVF